jgi:Asp/Glu/hydantoin racemase
MAAEKNGYNAGTIGCYLDTGLQKARSLVDIPVLAITEASMLVSCTLGKKFAFVTITPSMQEHLMESAVNYGLESRAAAILSIEPAVHEYMMEGDEETCAIVERRFLMACDKALEAGADVIIPGEGVLNEFLLTRGILTYKGVPILDGNAVLWQFAVMQAKLREKSGVGGGRRMTYKKPPQDLLDTLQTVHGCYNLKESDFS